ncbi:MAG: hypothetical protein QI197_08235 [Candidatus Korarchaeota archaeon]|nr:hypothetical protein [Candidatus Korarchaeota archaeon]
MPGSLGWDEGGPIWAVNHVGSLGYEGIFLMRWSDTNGLVEGFELTVVTS